MFPARSIAFMNLSLTAIFSIGSVFGAIILPSLLPERPIARSANSIPVYSSEMTQRAVSTIDIPVPSARLLFVGDIMLARGVEWQIGKNNLDYPLGDIKNFISNADLTIGNFEGTIRDEPNQELDGFIFDTTPTIASIVSAAGFDVVSLSNNHTDNHGSAIVQYTRQTLTDLGVTPFGDPYMSKDFIAHKTVNGIPISFIGFHAFGEDPESIVPTIEAEKAAGNFIVVLPHWGNEYEFTPSTAQTDAAHLFIDHGADAIIGAHPHVIQTYENYKGVPIIYSLGNFLFDQDWSIPTQQGLALGFDINASSIQLTFTPISIVKSHTTIMGADEVTKILSERNLPVTLRISRPIVQNTAAQQ